MRHWPADSGSALLVQTGQCFRVGEVERTEMAAPAGCANG